MKKLSKKEYKGITTSWRRSSSWNRANNRQTVLEQTRICAWKWNFKKIRYFVRQWNRLIQVRWRDLVVKKKATQSTGGWSCRIPQLHLCKLSKTPSKECLEYETQLHLMLRLVLCALGGEWSNHRCQLPGVIV